MNKNRQIISELKDFFKHNDASRAINAVNNVMERLVIQAKTVGPVKNPNCKFTFVQLVKLLVVLPFFSVKTAADYADSALGKLFSCKKDSFYRLMDDGRIDWRRIIYSINRQLIGLISRRADAKGNTRYVILDDTDLPKRGMKAEGLGKVFSHTAMKCILGFKAMFLCYTDGKTQLMVDATIQAESGKDASKPQGLTKKQKDAQYGKERGEDEKINTRKEEMLQSKIANAIKMLRLAIVEGLRFDYLLVDSGFPCAELLQFIHGRRFKCHVIGMIKMGKTKYDTTDGAMTANAIIAKELKRKNHVKYSRHYRFYYCEVAAIFAGTPIKLFFYRNGKKGEWNALLSTNTARGAYEAYKIYSRRWAIEVSFAEAKRLLNLGKCQCRDFASQIASISLCMLQYNTLGYVKRYESYETIGGVFRDVTQASVELTVTEKIYGILMGALQTIAEAFHFNKDEMMRAIINNNNNNNNNNKELNAVRRPFESLQLAA